MHFGILSRMHKTFKEPADWLSRPSSASFLGRCSLAGQQTFSHQRRTSETETCYARLLAAWFHAVSHCLPENCRLATATWKVFRRNRERCVIAAAIATIVYRGVDNRLAGIPPSSDDEIGTLICAGKSPISPDNLSRKRRGRSDIRTRANRAN